LVRFSAKIMRYTANMVAGIGGRIMTLSFQVVSGHWWRFSTSIARLIVWVMVKMVVR